MIGEPLAGLLRPKDGEGLEKHLGELRSTGEAVVLRVQTSASGEIVPVELSLSPIRIGSSLRGFAVGLYDRREQERLIWAGRLAALGEMVGALAHEINNPLNNIVTAIKTLRKASFVDTDSLDPRESLSILQHGARRITELVRRLRRLSRNEPSAYIEIDLKRLLREFIDFFSRRLMAARINLQVSLPDANPLILGDPVQIEQVLTSLVVNAQEAMKTVSSKQLFIEVIEVGDGIVRVIIEDSGPGVPEAHRDDIFDLFFTTKSRQGTGFGLSISRAIAREHGGDLRLGEATGLDGAQFILELPTLGVPSLPKEIQDAS